MLREDEDGKIKEKNQERQKKKEANLIREKG